MSDEVKPPSRCFRTCDWLKLLNFCFSNLRQTSRPISSKKKLKSAPAAMLPVRSSMFSWKCRSTDAMASVRASLEISLVIGCHIQTRFKKPFTIFTVANNAYSTRATVLNHGNFHAGRLTPQKIIRAVNGVPKSLPRVAPEPDVFARAGMRQRQGGGPMLAPRHHGVGQRAWRCTGLLTWLLTWHIWQIPSQARRRSPLASSNGTPLALTAALTQAQDHGKAGLAR